MFGYSGVSKCQQWRYFDAVIDGSAQCWDSSPSYGPARLVCLSSRNSEWLWASFGVSRIPAETARVVALRPPTL